MVNVHYFRKFVLFKKIPKSLHKFCFDFSKPEFCSEIPTLSTYLAYILRDYIIFKEVISESLIEYALYAKKC